MINQATDLYDALAPYYRNYSDNKSAYLSAVDKFVIGHIPPGAESLLDVGAGDGIRGMSIAQQTGIKYTVLCDPSPEMIRRCKALHPSEVWNVSAEELPDTGIKFDVILCLWNVLGHLKDRASRIKALSRMRELLTDKGIIFFDVNNRHNAASYGWARVIGRLIIDFFNLDEQRGDAVFDWKIGEQTFPAMGHLFTPHEIEGIIKESGLKVKERIAVNYSDGQVSMSILKGQLLYLISNK